jgi:hypothetical protein
MQTAKEVPMFLMNFQTAVGIEAILRVETLGFSQKIVRAHACTLTSLSAYFPVIISGLIGL